MKVLGSPWSGCCFSAKHAALSRNSKDWLTRNQDNVSEQGDMFILVRTKRVGLVQRGPYHHFIEN